MGDLFGGGWSAVAQDLVNWGHDVWGTDKAADMADHAMDFQRDQSRAAMDFSERMYKNRYQYQVGDLQAAGLNPMLSYMTAAPAAPTGTAGPGSMGTPKTGYDSRLTQNLASAATVDNIRAQTDNIDADTKNKLAENPVIMGKTGIQNLEMNLLRQQAETSMSQERLNDEERRLVFERIRNAIKEGHQIDARTGNIKVDTVLKELDVPKARNEAAAQQSDYMKNIAPYTGELGKLVGSAAEAKRAFDPATHTYRRAR